MGILPRMAEELFQQLDQLPHQGEALVSLRILELQAEVWRDTLGAVLLPAAEQSGAPGMVQSPGGSHSLHGAASVQVRSAGEVLALLGAATAARATASTRHNTNSSRSHLVCQISLHLPDAEPSTLTVVDLAGAESAPAAVQETGGATPHQGAADLGGGAVAQRRRRRARVSAGINTSLAALSNVLRALAADRPHVPLRASKLTRLLAPALLGSGACTLVVCASPSDVRRSETRASLRFAATARRVKPRNTRHRAAPVPGHSTSSALEPELQRLVGPLHAAQVLGAESGPAAPAARPGTGAFGASDPVPSDALGQGPEPLPVPKPTPQPWHMTEAVSPVALSTPPRRSSAQDAPGPVRAVSPPSSPTAALAEEVARIDARIAEVRAGLLDGGRAPSPPQVDTLRLDEDRLLQSRIESEVKRRPVWATPAASPDAWLHASTRDTAYSPYLDSTLRPSGHHFSTLSPAPTPRAASVRTTYCETGELKPPTPVHQASQYELHTIRLQAGPLGAHLAPRFRAPGAQPGPDATGAAIASLEPYSAAAGMLRAGDVVAVVNGASALHMPFAGVVEVLGSAARGLPRPGQPGSAAQPLVLTVLRRASAADADEGQTQADRSDDGEAPDNLAPPRSPSPLAPAPGPARTAGLTAGAALRALLASKSPRRRSDTPTQARVVPGSPPPGEMAVAMDPVQRAVAVAAAAKMMQQLGEGAGAPGAEHAPGDVAALAAQAASIAARVSRKAPPQHEPAVVPPATDEPPRSTHAAPGRRELWQHAESVPLHNRDNGRLQSLLQAAEAVITARRQGDRPHQARTSHQSSQNSQPAPASPAQDVQTVLTDGLFVPRPGAALSRAPPPATSDVELLLQAMERELAPPPHVLRTTGTTPPPSEDRVRQAPATEAEGVSGAGTHSAPLETASPAERGGGAGERPGHVASEGPSMDEQDAQQGATPPSKVPAGGDSDGASDCRSTLATPPPPAAPLTPPRAVQALLHGAGADDLATLGPAARHALTLTLPDRTPSPEAPEDTEHAAAASTPTSAAPPPAQPPHAHAGDSGGETDSLGSLGTSSPSAPTTPSATAALSVAQRLHGLREGGSDSDSPLSELPGRLPSDLDSSVDMSADGAAAVAQTPPSTARADAVPLDEFGQPLQGLDLLQQTHSAVEVRFTAPPLKLRLEATGVDEEDGLELGAAVKEVSADCQAHGVLDEGDLLAQVTIHPNDGGDEVSYELLDVGYADIMDLLKTAARGLRKQRMQVTLLAFRAPPQGQQSPQPAP